MLFQQVWITNIKWKELIKSNFHIWFEGKTLVSKIYHDEWNLYQITKMNEIETTVICFSQKVITEILTTYLWCLLLREKDKKYAIRNVNFFAKVILNLVFKYWSEENFSCLRGKGVKLYSIFRY